MVLMMQQSQFTLGTRNRLSPIPKVPIKINLFRKGVGRIATSLCKSKKQERSNFCTLTPDSRKLQTDESSGHFNARLKDLLRASHTQRQHPTVPNLPIRFVYQHKLSQSKTKSRPLPSSRSILCPDTPNEHPLRNSIKKCQLQMRQQKIPQVRHVRSKPPSSIRYQFCMSDIRQKSPSLQYFQVKKYYQKKYPKQDQTLDYSFPQLF